jgi:thymidylate kinase
MRYCVLHGYEEYPHRVGSDVDCIIDCAVSPSQLYTLFHRERPRIGADVVRWRDYDFTLAGKDAEGRPCFVTLDFSIECETAHLKIYPGRKVLESRRRYLQFWVPEVRIEFACYLTGTILKGRLESARLHRLSALFQEDARGCAEELARLWPATSAPLLREAASSGDWERVRHCLPRLQRQLRRHALLRSPLHFLSSRTRGLLNGLVGIWRPQGLTVVLLGPDGAGKSSVIDALPAALAPAFNRTVCFGFVPSMMLNLLHGRNRGHSTPHDLPPRSPVVSVLRAVLYWFVYYMTSYPVRRLMMGRAHLILHDRHFIDAVVDSKRYRYGGPVWLLRFIWRIIPKPDLIILLDAPPEVLQRRKQEVSLEETARQRSAYLSLVQSLDNGHVVNTDQALGGVVADVSSIILRHLAQREARRAFKLIQERSAKRNHSNRIDTEAVG